MSLPTPTGTTCNFPQWDVPMAPDEENITHHLTRNGWVISDNPPLDRVETWNRYTEETSGRSERSTKWTCTWANPAIPRSERNALRERFSTRMLGSGEDRVSIGDPL
jgi:hypothetical protein